MNIIPFSRRVCILLILAFCGWGLNAQQEYPHILVTNGEKPLILKKIKDYAWAGTIYDEIRKEVTPYAERHQTDREWILSRYLMNRIPGKRYTKVYSENGQGLYRWEGDAPVPTVRVATYLRIPITEKGTGYRKPSIEELVPYDTSRVMHLFNPETGQKEWIDPQEFITDINGDINELALEAAIVFWLTGEEKYAVFTADILDQWAKGAYYQEPIQGPCRTGFLDMQTLGDGAYRSLILAYDFVKTFMRQKGYDLQWYEAVFEKFASTLAFRGFWNNNWYAAESSTMVFAALSLDNTAHRDYYLHFFLEKDTINGGCGQLALPSTVKKWLTHDGHWKEPGGYHNYPVGNLLISALALEKNGYDIFRRFPELFRASYAMLKYSFPNLTVSAFGDTGRASQSPESLETGILAAIRYHQPELPEMLASMKKLTGSGLYRRENSGYMGLLCFLPEWPETASDYTWPRTGCLDFARYFLQRNGTDPLNGLMVGVQGATYNHNHCNGMAMELYGLGQVMGIDAGTGPNYEHPMHRNYYSQWAAHNTVVAAGSSSSVPPSGAAGTKNIGQIELAAMEPIPDSGAVSPLFSFTDTRYFDQSTQTRQSRTLALVRTSPASGYYIDIYRSDNPISNDYVYHNTGDSVVFLNEERKIIRVVDGEYPLTGKDLPGFRFFSNVRKLEHYTGNLTALFTLHKDGENPVFLQALIPGDNGRTYFQALSPKTKTAGRSYNGKPLPLFTIRTGSEARSKPFVVLFEPYTSGNGYLIRNVSFDNKDNRDQFAALTVDRKDGQSERIFQSVEPARKFSIGTTVFQGYYGVARYNRDKLTTLYLGKGEEISCSGYSIKSKSAGGSASLEMDGKTIRINCNQETKITLPLKKLKKAILLTGTTRERIKTKAIAAGISMTVPAVINGVIKMR